MPKRNITVTVCGRCDREIPDERAGGEVQITIKNPGEPPQTTKVLDPCPRCLGPVEAFQAKYAKGYSQPRKPRTTKPEAAKPGATP